MQNKQKGLEHRKSPKGNFKIINASLAASISLICLSSFALFGKYILFADGAYMTGMIGQTQNFFINTVEWNRSASYVITQFLAYHR